MRFKLVPFVSAVTVGIGLVSFPAISQASTYTFTAAGCAVCSVTPIGTVTTSFAAGVETVSVQLNGAYHFWEAGNPPEIAFNVTGAPALTYTFPTQAGLGWIDSGAQGPLGATGSFNESIGTDHAIQHNVDLGQLLSFSFASASAASFFANADGFTFAADLCTTISEGACTGSTGFAGAVLSSVPIPPAAFLFGTALAGIVMLGRTRKKPGFAATAS